MEPKKQREVLSRFLAERTEKQRRGQIAAEVLRSYLRRGCRDLVALRKELVAHLSEPVTLLRQ